MLSGPAFTAERVAAEVEALIDRAGAGLDEAARPELVYELRYAGQAFELPVPGPPDPDPADLAAHFEAAHEERYGHRDPGGEVVLVDIRLAMVEPGPEPRPAAAAAGRLEESSRRIRGDGEWVEARVLRGEPPAGTAAEGPIVFELPESTLVLPAIWKATVDPAGTIVATNRSAVP
jgi:N-methylhydantoinase A